LRNPEFLEELRKLDADVFVVVAFRMMPKVLFEMPKMGTFNLHASFFLITEEQPRSIMQLLMVKKKPEQLLFYQ
jgi:hypothetical protein